MKAQELRIGNYVKLFLNHEDYDVIQIKIDDLYYINQKNGIYEPIPLTEEWLEKFGYEWSIFHQAWHRLGFVFDLSERGVMGYYMHMTKRNNEIVCPEIIYVHQLQNLYFALTGEELILKES